MHNKSPSRPQLVTPTTWSSRGEAALPGSRRVLVWQGIPGEPARVRLEHEGNHQVLTRWMGSPQPSPRRVQPPCEKIDACGGCPLMHLDKLGQADARAQIVGAALRGLDVKVEPLVQDQAFEFRHVIKLLAGFSDNGHWRLGAPARNSRRVVPIPDCNVVTPKLRRFTMAAAHHMIDVGLEPWTPEADGYPARGTLRWVVARESASTGQILVLIVAGRADKRLGEYADRLMKATPEIVGIHVHFNEMDSNAILNRDEEGKVGTKCLLGNDEIVESVAGIPLRVGPTDFFQTHPAMANALVADAVKAVGGHPTVDLYCGVGAFTLALAKAGGWALGVEEHEGAIRRARQSAADNRLPAEFLRAQVVEALPEIGRRLAGKRPVVLVDPARRGLEDGVIDGVLALNPRRIVYVSCNPEALGRDLHRFVEAGWSIQMVRPYDMFPHTPHVEVLAVLDPPGPVEAEGRGPRRRVVR